MPTNTMTDSGAHVLGDYATCQKLFEYRHVKGLQGKGTGLPLVIGSAWHKLLEAYYWGYALIESVGACKGNVPKDIEASALEPFDAALSTGLTALGVMQEDEFLADKYESTKQLLTNMLTYYHAEVTRLDVNTAQVFLDADRKQPAIECYFELPLWGEYTFTGRLDRIFRRSGLLLVQEHKTTTPQGVAFLERSSRMAVQFTGYVLGCHALLGDYPNAIELSAITKHSNPKLHRVPITRTRAELEEFKIDAAHILIEVDNKLAMLDRGEEPRFLRTGILNGYCVQYGRQCIYQPLCKSPQQDLNNFALDQIYTIKEQE